MGKEKETIGADEQNQLGQEQNKQEDSKKVDDDKVLSLTETEFNKKLQAETDRRVTSALKTAQLKWEQEFEEKLQKEKEEAEKLAKLSEEEKRKVLDEKRTRELEEREAKIYQKELEIAAIKILDGKKLPVKFAKTLLGKDAEETHSNIENFEKEYQKAIEDAVAERMKGFTPQASTSNSKEFDMNTLIRQQAKK